MLDSYIKDKFFPDYETGTMVEVGAAGPDKLSQSKYFRDLGWRCICVEPNPKFAQMHRDVGNEIYEYACADYDADDVDFEVVNTGSNNNESFSSLKVGDDIAKSCGYIGRITLNISNINVKVRKLDTILEEAKISRINYIVVDVEGWELDVMRGFSLEKYRPKVIVLENNILDKQDEYNQYMEESGYKYDSEYENYIDENGPNKIYFKL